MCQEEWMYKVFCDPQLQVSMRSYALAYAEMGFAVVPLRIPAKRGISCVPKFKGWQQTDFSFGEIEELWSDEQPVSNVGIRIGPEHLLVFDIDDPVSHNHRPLSEEEKALRSRVLKMLKPIRTVSVATPGNGLHIWCNPGGFDYKKQSPLRVGGVDAVGIDIIGHGSFIPAPPSIKFIDGQVRSYDFVAGEDLFDQSFIGEAKGESFGSPLADITEELASLLGLWRPEVRPAKTKPKFTSDPVRMREAKAWLADQPPTNRDIGEDGDNNFYRLVCRFVQKFRLSIADSVEAIMSLYVDECHPRWTETEIRHKVECATDYLAPRMRWKKKKKRKAQAIPKATKFDLTKWKLERGLL